MKQVMSKITTEHLTRTACVYVRQSSVDQVLNNTESQRRQYALKDKAHHLGFSDVIVIDEDLGRSAGGIARRGFERLLTLICEERVGAVFALEASRLARNGRDWHALLEVCALFNAVLVDEDGVYDPRLPNDRLLLGMRGEMAVLELSLLHQRAIEAIRQKAARGELIGIVPIGYVRGSSASLQKDADKRVRASIDLVFQKFEQLRSVRQVLLWFLEKGIQLPVRHHRRDEVTILWNRPTYTRVSHILKNPTYAGAYVFGRTATTTRVEKGRKHVYKKRVSPFHWRVCIQGHHEGYISWECFMRNQGCIAENANMRGEAVRGAVRHGDALLTGLIRCGHCGRKLSVAYTGKDVKYPRYYCHGSSGGGRMNRCISFSAWRVDGAVAEEFLKVIAPIGLEAAVKAIGATDTSDQEEYQQIALSLQQAQFEARHAQRQYEAVDPDNRLVAAELERRWNEKLIAVNQLQERLASAHQKALPPLTQADRARFLALGDDLPRVWNDSKTTMEAKKRIVRAALKEIVARVDNGKIRLLLHWQGGDHTEVITRKNKTGEHRFTTDLDTVKLIALLARQMPDFSIAALLNRIGTRTATGLTWNEQRLRAFRSDRDIEVYKEGERAERGEVTASEAAAALGVSKMTVLRLIQLRILPAQQACSMAPWVILKADLARSEVRKAIKQQRQPQPGNPKQEPLKFQ
jgi:DNA invertase Pin-like site-specific DNA recombinase